ncbi:MAG: tRNA uridine(34) 5-carboxymethylaminomethyl modification radical SAM/GNAT enzyme Elp3 [Candidatus Woesearchaeota archaeon]|jgi:elongator complex protein 3
MEIENINSNTNSGDVSTINLTIFLEKLLEFIKSRGADNSSKIDIAKQKVVLCKELKIKRIPTDIELFLNAKKEDVEFLKKYMQTKPMRTESGVAVVAVMSAPGKCPHGKCIYCPGGMGSVFGDVPQSYTGNEPATMRGLRNNYDAYLQVMNRLEQYVAIGQNPEKVELIILGGTFLAFEKEYQDNFIRDIYQAMNDFSKEFYAEYVQESKLNLDVCDLDNKDIDSKTDVVLDKVKVFNIDKFKEFFELPGNIKNKIRTDSIKLKLISLKKRREVTLKKAQKENELSMIRCVGLTIETKPDWGFVTQGNSMLEYGCTRVELGIQTLNDDTLQKVNRGHSLNDTKKSVRELKDLGFKLNFHMMPGLPGSTKETDINDLKNLFEDESYVPDMLKIYPTMVMPGTGLAELYKRKEYVPLTLEGAVDIISDGLKYVPKYCRVMRIQRDIPAKFANIAIAQNNLRQLVSLEVIRKGFKEKDIKAREIGNREITIPVDFEIINYKSSGGDEYFISLVDSKDMLLGFIRLRFPSQLLRIEITKNTALIRELHVYGKSLALKGENGKVQHKGYGRLLMAKAEEIAKSQEKDKILVISGIGVREYYKKLGYCQEGPYMAKKL